ncbi:MAG: GDP-L-fucose synthase [Proteobacteria bacterium]|nr:GDP-L-fucose synthase [Pseudomonadota bacterium]
MSDGGSKNYSLTGKRVWINGYRGMVGQALVRQLETIDCEILRTTSEELDLRRQADAEDWMNEKKPEAVFLCAATVGGILANNTRPAEFLYDNLAIEANVIHGAWRTGVEKLLYLGTGCMYPREAPQPIPEDCLLTGPLEPTNEWYAVAKIAGLKMCQAYRRQYGCDFITALPTNLYGPGDNFDPKDSHVIPALILKAHAAKADGAKAMEVWGSGTPLREFLYVDDAAKVLVFLMQAYSEEAHINVGLGKELSIREVAETIVRVVGFEGELVFDTKKPDGMPRKLLDASRLSKLGQSSATGLEDGLNRTYAWFLENKA